MKRYEFFTNGLSPLEVGNWVKYSDAEAALVELRAQVAGLREAMTTVRMRLEVAHRLLDLATGPSGARAAFKKIEEAIKDIDGVAPSTTPDTLAQMQNESAAKALEEFADSDDADATTAFNLRSKAAAIRAGGKS